MAGSSIKLGIDVTEFKRGMTEAQASVKTLDAAIKTNEKSMQAYGKTESYVSTQTSLLNQKLKEQEKIAQNAEKSLKAMDENGVSKSSKAYQDMQRRMIEARGAMLDTTMQLNQLATGEADAAKGADQLANSIGGIGKKMSLDQVIGGIDKVTGALENAAKSAIDLGQKLFDVILDSAAAADDISTMATRLGLTDEQVQQINYNAASFEITAEQLGKTWKKVKVNMASDSDEIKKAFAELGVETHEVFGGKYGSIEGEARDYQDVFWDIGDALMRMTDESKREQMAQKLLGRSWDEMIPLFTKGRAAYEAALEAAPTASEEAVENMANLNDRMKELEQSWETLKLEALGAIAPALEKGADAIATLLDKITEYLKTDAGQQMLQNLGNAVSGLFDDLSKIDPEETTQAFVNLFTKVTDGIQWLVDNKETAKGILGAIVAGWGTLKLTEGVLTVVKLVDGIKGLTGIGAAEGAAAGASWGGAFASAVLKAAPWLAGLIALLTPADTGDNSIVDANGNLTAEGQMLEDQKAAEEERLNNRTPREKWLDEMAQKYNGTMGISAYNMEALGTDPIFLAIQAYWDKYRNSTATNADWEALQSMMDSTKREQFKQVAAYMYNADRTMEDLPYEAFGFTDSFDEWMKEHGEEGVPITIDPVIPDDAATVISEDIGSVPITITIRDVEGKELLELLGGADGENANGIWAVPYDGYLARLHKNERVVPAREVSSRNFSSNLYVESMIMNNGTDAAGLAASMAAAQRRTMAGFGN